ncbi:hypothetical protein Tco_1422480, partial [Tanacetum coccineum]
STASTSVSTGSRVSTVSISTASTSVSTGSRICSMVGEDENHDENANIPPPVPPTQQAPHTLSTIKLHILKKGEYDIWAMKMEHYLGHTDYPIWERERERKARTTLIMSTPEDHLAKFHKLTDAKEMCEAIKSRFGGNDESKKMQKYILNQQFESFSASPLKMPIRSSLGLYLLPGPNTQNVAFISSSTGITNDVSTAYGVSTSSGHNSQKEGSSSYIDELIRDGFEMASGHDFYKIEEVLQEDKEKAVV